MLFNPPQIEHIKQVLPVIKDNPAFVVKEKGWYTVIDYMYMTDKLFHEPIERECRGIKFCSKSGKILARPYHKFHNLNEREDYRTENVDLSRPHVILDKLDGSMVHTCPSELGIYLMTRMGVTEVAEAADKFLMANSYRYGRLLNALPVDEYTYIFEYVGPNNKIVLDYKEEDLILTAIRHNTNGTYIFHEELTELGKTFGVKVVQAFPFNGYDNHMGRIAENIASQTNTEGYVVRFDTGAMLKIKCDEYVRKHKTKDLVSSQKGIMALILEDKIDDVLPQLDTDVADRVKDYAAEINKLINNYAAKIEYVVECDKEKTQKEFALGIKDSPKDLQSLLFTVRKGDNARETVVKQLLRNCKTNKAITDLLQGKGWPLWTFSFFSEE